MKKEQFRLDKEDQELLNQELILVLRVGLRLAWIEHINRGDEGREEKSPNQFGEMALKADVEAEKLVLSAIKDWAERNVITVNYRGEESGEGVFGSLESRRSDKCLVVVDGLDGSANYLHKTDWGYGTMIAIAHGEDPTYDDFETAAIMMPEEGWTILAQKGKGVYLIPLDGAKIVKLRKFEDEAYDEHRILSDNYFEEAKKLLGKKQEIWPRTGSTAATIVAIAIGNQVQDSKYPVMNEGWQALVDVTRKGNLEQPILYRIISELGGVMLDKDGKSIGDRKFKEWGQIEKLPVITAKNARIAECILTNLKASI